eukprot:m.226910 g.226910  ORF g.226910 m.226910 type:complete len:489 (-) comp25935_c1_seq12:1766-3232(-)
MADAGDAAAVDVQPVVDIEPNFDVGLKGGRIGIQPALWKPDSRYKWQDMVELAPQQGQAPDPVMERAHKAATTLEPILAKGFQNHTEVKFFEPETRKEDPMPSYNKDLENIKGKNDKMYGFESFHLNWKEADRRFDGPALNTIMTTRPLLNPTDRVWLNTPAELSQAASAIQKAYGQNPKLGGSRTGGAPPVAQPQGGDPALQAEVADLQHQIAQFNAGDRDVGALRQELADVRAVMARQGTMSQREVDTIKAELQQAHADIHNLTVGAAEKKQMQRVIEELRKQLEVARSPKKKEKRQSVAPTPAAAATPGGAPAAPKPSRTRTVRPDAEAASADPHEATRPPSPRKGVVDPFAAKSGAVRDETPLHQPTQARIGADMTPAETPVVVDPVKLAKTKDLDELYSMMCELPSRPSASSLRNIENAVAVWLGMELGLVDRGATLSQDKIEDLGKTLRGASGRGIGTSVSKGARVDKLRAMVASMRSQHAS